MFWANSMAWFTGLILAGLFDRACHWFMVLECLLHDLQIKKKYKRRFSSHCFHYIWKKLWAIPWRWLKHLFCNFLSVQFCLLLFLSLFCRFFVISVLACNFVCHVPNNFWYFPYFWDNCTNKWPKKRQTNPPNDKNYKKVTILQVAKMTFFSKHCIFLSFFCHCSNTFNMIEKCAKIIKMTKIHYMTKILKTWQFCRLQKLHVSRSIVFSCHFSVISARFSQKICKNIKHCTENTSMTK